MALSTWTLSILALGAAASIYWGARQYGPLIREEGAAAEAFWPCFGIAMLAGLLSVSVLCRKANVRPRVAFALLALSTVAVMILYSLGRSAGPGLVESSGKGWLYAPVNFQLWFIGAHGLFASFLLVETVVRRSQHHG